MTSPVTIGRANQRRGEAERLAVATWFVRAGFRVINFSQPGLPRGRHGRRGTYQTAGIPDLRVYDPRGVVTPFWYEVKSGDARLTAEQRDFQQLCAAQEGEPYFFGGVERAKDLLRHLGLLVVRGDVEVLEPIREGRP